MPKSSPSEDYSEARYQTNEAELLQLFARYNRETEEKAGAANRDRIQEILERAKADVQEHKVL